MPQVAARIPIDLEERLKQSFRTKSAGAEFLLPWAMGAFSRSMSQIRKEFSVVELKAIIEAYRGATLLPEQCKLSYLMLRLSEAFEMEEITGPQVPTFSMLERKLNRLGDTEAAGLMIWAAAYWLSPEWRGVSMDDYLKNS